MKTSLLHINKGVALAFLLGLLTLGSCSKMNDLSDRFLDQGETIYAAKVTGWAAQGGEERIRIILLIESQRIETVRVYWNNYADSTDIAIGNQTGLFFKMLPNMPESGYIFQLVSLDKFGNKSLPIEVDGNSYGERFRSSIENRAITSAFSEGSKLTITWGGTVDKSIGNQLLFINNNNQEEVLFVSDSLATTVIPNWKSGLRYNTLFIPEAYAIDTFATATVSQKTYKKINKTIMIATADSYEDEGQLPNGPPEKTIDDDLSTFWHTHHKHDDVPGFPHWLAYNLNQSVPVSMIELTASKDNWHRDFRQFTVQGSNDGTNWTDYATFRFADTNNTQRFVIDSAPVVRHIRIWMFDGTGEPYGFLAEFSAYSPEN